MFPTSGAEPEWRNVVCAELAEILADIRAGEFTFTQFMDRIGASTLSWNEMFVGLPEEEPEPQPFTPFEMMLAAHSVALFIAADWLAERSSERDSAREWLIALLLAAIQVYNSIDPRELQAKLDQSLAVLRDAQVQYTQNNPPDESCSR